MEQREKPGTPDLLTAEEVAAILRVAPKTVYRYMSQGTLPSVRIGGAVRVSREELAAYLSRQQKGQSESAAQPAQATRAKCASCMRLLPQEMLTAFCLAPGCGVPLCTDCQAQWPDLRCPQHRPTQEQRAALARAQGKNPMLAMDTALWEQDFQARFTAAVEALEQFPHPLGGMTYARNQSRRIEERLWGQESQAFLQAGPMPRGTALSYVFPAGRDGRPGWALAAGAMARLDRLLREGFDADPIDPALWQAWFGQLSQRAAEEQRVLVIALASPTGWDPRVASLAAGSAQQRPHYDRWVAFALTAQEEGISKAWSNPADGRLKPYLHLFLGRLPAETDAVVRGYIRQQWRMGAPGVTVAQVQEVCQVDPSAVQNVFHQMEREGAGAAQWIDGFGLTLFPA